MRDNKFNLQILHHSEVFQTREQAIDYLNDFYKPNSLEGEPVLVKYGNERTPNVMLAFGTTDKAPGGFFIIDTEKINESVKEIKDVSDKDKQELKDNNERLQELVKSIGFTIDENKIKDKISYPKQPTDFILSKTNNLLEAVLALSEYVQSGFEFYNLTPETSKSIKTTITEKEDGGQTIKSEIILSNDGDSDDLAFNNNILGIKNDGLFAASNLSYDEEKKELVFTTSGYKNGRYQDDAIVQRVKLGNRPNIKVQNEDKNISLSVKDAENEFTLSAEAKISSNEDNILESKEGKLQVLGQAKKIKYGDSNVETVLDEFAEGIDNLTTLAEQSAKTAHIEVVDTDTIYADVETLPDGGSKILTSVKLGDKKSIIVKDNGLEVNLSLDIDVATNTLILKLGEEVIKKQLPGIEIFERAEYNDQNEEIVLTFKNNKVLTLPIHSLIHTWKVSNDTNSPITLEKTLVSGGVDTLSANVKLRSTDNLIGIDNGLLYVSEKNILDKISDTSKKDEEITEKVNALTLNVEKLKQSTQQDKENANAKFTAQDALIKENTSRFETVSEKIVSVKEDLLKKTSDFNELLTNVKSELDKEVLRASNEEKVINNKVNEGFTNTTSEINTLNIRYEKLDSKLEKGIETLKNETSENINTSLTNAKKYTDDGILSEKNQRVLKETEVANTISNLSTELKNSIKNTSDELKTKISEDIQEVKNFTTNKVNEVVEKEKTRAEQSENETKTKLTELEKEVSQKVSSVTVEKNGELEYIINVNGAKVGTINIPKDQFFKGAKYNQDTKTMSFVFMVDKDNQLVQETTDINISDLVDTYTSGNGLSLSNNQFSVKISPASERFLTVTSDGLSINGLETELNKKSSKEDVKLISDKVEILNGNALVEGSVSNTISKSNETLKVYINTKFDDVNKNISLEQDRATKSESVIKQFAENSKQELTQKIENKTQELTQNLENLNNDFTRKLENNVALIQGKADATNVYTKTEIDNKHFVTDVSNLATKSELAESNTKIGTQEFNLTKLKQEVADMKFVTSETDTILVSMDKQVNSDHRTFKANVKLKTLTTSENANIIKSDNNGLYASVSLNYNPANNTLTFNDGNGDKELKLNNNGIVQDAFYETETKSIVLVIKKSDKETQRIVVPVSTLVNTWSVENTVTSPINLQKRTTERGDVLTANLSILNNTHNLLKVDSGSLFVDDDSNKHFALWGNEETTVQGVINILKTRTDDLLDIKNKSTEFEKSSEKVREDLDLAKQNITKLDSAIKSVEGDVRLVKDKQTEIQNDIHNIKDQLAQQNAKMDALTLSNTSLQNGLQELKNKLEGYETTTNSRLEKIEAALAKLIDFGLYNIN